MPDEEDGTIVCVCGTSKLPGTSLYFCEDCAEPVYPQTKNVERLIDTCQDFTFVCPDCYAERKDIQPPAGVMHQGFFIEPKDEQTVSQLIDELLRNMSRGNA